MASFIMFHHRFRLPSPLRNDVIIVDIVVGCFVLTALANRYNLILFDLDMTEWRSIDEMERIHILFRLHQGPKVEVVEFVR